MWSRLGLTNAQVLEAVASYTSGGERNEETPGMKPPSDKSEELGVTPSADPELWAAIVASLEDQKRHQGRHLSRHLSDVSPELAIQLRQERHQQLRCSPEGVTYFSFEGGEDASTDGGNGSKGRNGFINGDSAGQPGGSGGLVHGLPEAPARGDCGLVLPSFATYPPAVREAVLGSLCNEYLQNEAEVDGLINGVPGCTPQLVLTTLGDGNCLSHSCSLGVWGIHDRDGRLRGAIHATMAHPFAGQQIRARFERHLAASGIPQEDWAAEWDRELISSASSSTFMSDVHAYTLANVLRRPLLIYERLRLHWQASTCPRCGLLPKRSVHASRWHCCLGGAISPCSPQFKVHHTPSELRAGEGPASPPLLPLCTRDGPLQLRFLSDTEAHLAGEGASSGSGSSSVRQLTLLRRYMDAERLFNGRLGVRLSESPQPHVLVSLLGSQFLERAQKDAAAQQQQRAASQAEHQQQQASLI